MIRHTALALAFAVAVLSVQSAGATVVTGSRPVGELDVAATAQCGAVGMTIVINRTSAGDEIGGTIVTAEKIAGIDLITQAGWDRVANLTIEEGRTAPKEGSWSATSDAQGRATFADLPVGVYYVSATAPDDGRHLTPADFIVTLPVTGPHGWDCNPVINAKFRPDPPVTSDPVTSVPSTSTPPTTEPDYPPFTPEVPLIPPADPTDPVQGSGGFEAGSKVGSGLASTGAAVTGVVAVATGLLALGILLVRRKKDEG